MDKEQLLTESLEKVLGYVETAESFAAEQAVDECEQAYRDKRDQQIKEQKEDERR